MQGLLVLAALASPAEVQWQAPNGCPSREAFIARVSDPSAETRPFSVAVNIERVAEATWRAELAITRDGSEEERRVVEGESCQAVADAAALIVELRTRRRAEATPEAVVIKPPPPLPETAPQPAAVVTEEPPERSPATTSTRFEPSLDDEPQRKRTPRGAWLALSGGVAAGVLPGVGGAAAVEGGVDGHAWRVGVAARLVPARIERGVATDIDGGFTLATAGAIGCYVPRVGAWAFPTCGRVDVGTLRGEGRNATQPRVVWPLWAGVSVAGSARWDASERIAPFVALEGVAALLVPSYAVGSVGGAFFQAGRWGARAWLGIEIRLKNGPQKR